MPALLHPRPAVKRCCSAAALQCSSAADSSPTTKHHDFNPCNPKGSPVAQKPCIEAATLRCSPAAQQPSTPANQQSCSTAAVQRRSQAIFNCGDPAALPPCTAAWQQSCPAAAIERGSAACLDYRKQLYQLLDAAVQASTITLLIWARLLGIVFFLFGSTGKGRRSDVS